MEATRGTAWRVTAGLVALALVIAGVAWRNGSHRPRRVVTEPKPQAAPATFIGIKANRLAEFSSATGEWMRWLSNDAAAEPRVAGDDVWYLRSDAALCQDAIYKVNRQQPDDATKIVAAAGRMSTLAVSADGTRVAWTLSPCPNGAPVLHVLDRATGDGRVIAMGAPPTIYGPPSWSPDDAHLALMARGGGGVAYGVSVIDAATATDIGFEPTLKGPYCYQELPQFLADGTLVVITCPEEDHRALTATRFDAHGNKLGRLFEVEGKLGEVTSFSLTRDGKHALYQVRPSRGPVATYRWDGGAVQRVTTDAEAVAW